jgi:MFS transporter, ACS family, tartrate transporter
VQYIGVTAVTNIARFFLPMLIREASPTLKPWQVGVVGALPAAAKVFTSPAVAAWADRRPAIRRFPVSWGVFACSAALLLLTGCLMLSAAGAPQDPMLAAQTVALLATADILTQAGISSFWAAHHAVQPAVLAPCSIALVNSVGNIGGFVGPVLLGSFHDRFGPACFAGAKTCTSSWAWGTVVIASGYALLTIATWCVTVRLDLAKQCGRDP